MVPRPPEPPPQTMEVTIIDKAFEEGWMVPRPPKVRVRAAAQMERCCSHQAVLV